MASAPAAYRKDLAANGQAFGERDGEWITIASLASSAALTDQVNMSAWDAAIDTTVHAFGAVELDRLARREWGAGWSDFEALTLASVAMYDTGAKALSALILDSVLRVRGDDQNLAYGRALAQRARSAYHANEREVADDLYRQVDLLGRRLNSVELRARAMNGFAGIAQTSGNHPKLLDLATQGLALAEQTGVPRIRWNARYTIMMSTALFRRFDESLEHGWALLNLGNGDPLGEGTALHSLGQLLLEMGDVDSAISAFSAAVSRPLPSRILLGSLGSLAIATALSGRNRQTVDWAVAEVLSFRNSGREPWDYTSALLDCIIALRDCGDISRALELRDEALSLCVSHRFNALMYRAEAIHLETVSSPPARATVAASASRIVQSVRQLAPRRLPRHVRLVGAGAVP